MTFTRLPVLVKLVTLLSLVASAASVTSVTSVEAANLKKERYPVTSVPKKLKLDPFYKKYTEAGGYPIVASAGVRDFAL